MLRSTVLILLIFAGVAAADVQTGLVRSGGQAVPGATVSAECGTDSKITTTTDDAGRFEIGGLPSTSCKYTVLMFGFEPLQKDAAASSTPITFDISLQSHATMPVAPKPTAPVAPVVSATPGTPTPSAVVPPAPAPPPDLPKPSMAAAVAAANAPPARGGRGARGASGATGNARGGRGGQAQGGRGGGFTNLSLVQNEDVAAASDAPPASLSGGTDAGVATGDSFTVNGTLSQGVQAQAGDGMGMGGPGGFGFGPGGPGGPGGDQFGPALVDDPGTILAVDAVAVVAELVVPEVPVVAGAAAVVRLDLPRLLSLAVDAAVAVVGVAADVARAVDPTVRPHSVIAQAVDAAPNGRPASLQLPEFGFECAALRSGFSDIERRCSRKAGDGHQRADHHARRTGHDSQNQIQPEKRALERESERHAQPGWRGIRFQRSLRRSSARAISPGAQQYHL